MAVKVFVPRLGEGVDELTIIRWLKQEGDLVREMEPLVEVESDKVVTEILSPQAGILLKIATLENTAVPVGAVLGWIGEPRETLDKPETPSSQPHIIEQKFTEVTHPVLAPEMSSATHGGFLSPIVRKMAAEHHLDLSLIHGTGLGGRITKQDVLDYLATQKTTGPAHSPIPMPVVIPMVGDQVLPVSSVRRQIAERMQQSKQVSPHVLTVMEADLSRVSAHRSANKENFSAGGSRLTYTAYFIAAIAAALSRYPLVNSSWGEQGILQHAEINIGIATSLGEEGLIVPVIHNADRLSLLGIAHTVNDLANRARTKQLKPEEVRGGTFTLTNHGTGGSLFAMPIINQPQCGILGTGSIQKRPVVVTDAQGNDAIAIRPMVYLSFVFDHRILDGASADAFLAEVKQVLEAWE
jgi:2-oxoglutarate dehydrogenase E2 component (dihydrolipoamide succinyltransferase)